MLLSLHLQVDPFEESLCLTFFRVKMSKILTVVGWTKAFLKMSLGMCECIFALCIFLQNLEGCPLSNSLYSHILYCLFCILYDPRKSLSFIFILPPHEVRVSTVIFKLPTVGLYVVHTWLGAHTVIYFHLYFLYGIGIMYNSSIVSAPLSPETRHNANSVSKCTAFIQTIYHCCSPLLTSNTVNILIASSVQTNISAGDLTDRRVGACCMIMLLISGPHSRFCW